MYQECAQDEMHGVNKGVQAMDGNEWEHKGINSRCTKHTNAMKQGKQRWPSRLRATGQAW